MQNLSQSHFNSFIGFFGIHLFTTSISATLPPYITLALFQMPPNSLLSPNASLYSSILHRHGEKKKQNLYGIPQLKNLKWFLYTGRRKPFILEHYFTSLPTSTLHELLEGRLCLFCLLFPVPSTVVAEGYS